MDLKQNFNCKDIKTLIGLESEFELLKDLMLKNRFPRVLLLSGEKGIGKCTLINHLMYFNFDRMNYDKINLKLKKKSNFYYQYLQNLFPNIYFIEGSGNQNTSIEEIRKLLKNLSKKSIISGKRFIILDDVETFNLNCLNSLLKMIEEPYENDHFILINNNTKKLIDTIKSRSLEIKIILSKRKKDEISSKLIEYYNQKTLLDKDIVSVSPGNFLKFNYMFNYKKWNLNNHYIVLLKSILSLYKKDKNTFYKDLIFFLTDYFLQKERNTNFKRNQHFIEERLTIFNILNNFFLYNLNQNTLLTSIQKKFNG